MSSSAETVVYRVVGAVLVMGAANVCVEAARLVNMRTGAEIPWFALAAVVVSITALRLCDKGYQTPPPLGWPRRYLWIAAALIFGAGLAALGLFLQDSDALRAGRVSLPGDEDPTAPLQFRMVTNYTKALDAGPIEEAPLRGLVQLGLTPTIGSLWAEVIAGLEFVLLHGSKLTNPGELLLVSATAFVNGRITAKSQSTRYATLAHCVSNLGILLGVLVFRGMARPG